MIPGPELDALVAIKVMGWKSCGDRWAVGAKSDRKRVKAKTCWKPSTNIAHAWKVVLKVTEIGGICKLETPLWGCTLHSGEIVEALTAPHAICLAALKAVTNE